MAETACLFAPSTTKMRNSSIKMPATSVYVADKMPLLIYSFNIVFFVLWVTWCVYRGVLCSLTAIPDAFAPANYSNTHPTLGLLLLIFPFIAPIVSALVSVCCLLKRFGNKWCNMFITAFTIVTLLFRMLIKPNVFLPFWF